MRTVKRWAAHEFFLFLLPLFFVMHGYIENREAMHFAEALLLIAEYTLVSLVIFCIAYIVIPSQRKAALFAFSIMFFHLFFGALHDGLKKLLPTSFLTQYSFVIPFAFVLFLVLLFYFRQSKRTLFRLAVYLNLLFILLIALDMPRLFLTDKKTETQSIVSNASFCDTCEKPDIYLLIADEYADSSSLQQIFSFNNSSFQQALRKRGFHVVEDSRSNYNFTPFAVASLFQMDYLKGIRGRNQDLSDRNKCYQWINSAGILNFFERNGYEIRNHSVFNLANKPTVAPQNYILIGKDMIVSHTFLSRLDRDLRYHLVVTLKLESEINRISYFMHHCNQLLLSRLLEEPKRQTPKPRFVYAHLTMPHYPYYFRSNGEPNPIELLQEGQQSRKKEYIEYLQFTNGLLLETIDRILTSSRKPPIILLMGDHGFREFPEGFEKNAPFYYMNLNAVLLPNRNYVPFYNGISTVNQFRALLNASFGQQLPYLKDSSILLYE
jgi:hypothetical protein